MGKNTIIKLTMSILLSFFMEDIFAKNISTAQSAASMAVGSKDASPTDHNSSGVILLSHDGWQTWKYPSIPDEYNKTFYSASCTDVSCVVVGAGPGVNAEGSGEIRISYDQGITWLIPDTSLFPPLLSVDCDHSTCIAVGHYWFADSANSYILLSQNGGKKWSNLNLKLDCPISKIQMEAVTHYKNRWIARGQYTLKDNLQNKAGIAISDDYGQTWQWNTPLNNLTGTNEEHLEGITCNTHICIAVGYYTQGLNTQAVMAIRNGTDPNWKVLTPLTYYPFSKLKDVSCSDQICLAVGEVKTQNNAETNGIILSLDAYGLEKYYFSSIFPGIRESHLVSVQCTDKNCIAVGYCNYQNNSKFRGMIIAVLNNGNLWKLSTIDNPDYAHIELLKVNNSNGIFNLIGMAQTDGNLSHTPLILTNHDEYESWDVRWPFANYGLAYSWLANFSNNSA